jgi:hypothetical protein
MKRKPQVNEMEKWEQFFAGMESASEDRKQARAEFEGEELTIEMRQPGKDISKKAGRIERESPLFHGTGENPTLFS